MNFEMFGKGRTGTRESLMKEQCVLVYETERHEFGEAAGLALNVPEQPHLPDPMLWLFRVSVHHGRSTANATLMGGADNLDPLRAGKLVGGEDVPDFVVQNFCGGSGQRAQAVVTQHTEIICERHARQFD